MTFLKGPEEENVLSAGKRIIREPKKEKKISVNTLLLFGKESINFRLFHRKKKEARDEKLFRFS